MFIFIYNSIAAVFCGIRKLINFSLINCIINLPIVYNQFIVTGLFYVFFLLQKVFVKFGEQ